MQRSWQGVDSEWPSSNHGSLYLRLDLRVGALVVDVAGLLAGAFFDVLPDPFVAFEGLDFSPFPAALDLLLCECFTGAMYVEVRLTLANWSPLSTRTW